MPAFCEGAGLPPLRTTGSIRVIRERKRVYGPNQTRIQHSTSVWNPAPEVLSASEHRAIVIDPVRHAWAGRVACM